MLTESGDDFIEQESRTAVGTCSHWSIVETSEQGTNIFITNEGQIYETTGLEAVDLGIDLLLTVDGINKTRLPYIQSKWFHNLKWYIAAYTSANGTEHDRILIYDKAIKQWVIWAIRGNALGIIESLESAQTVFKPWLGTRGGFPYKMITGDNFGAGSSGTLNGTISAVGSDYIDDSTASFNTVGDGLKDVYVSIFDTNDNFIEEQKILSNTATRLTVDTNWVITPVAGYRYEVGSIRWYWRSKILDIDTNESKTLDRILLNFKKTSIATNVKIKIFVSENPTMPTTEDQTITFDLTQDYYDLLGVLDTRFRYFQYELSGHGCNTPVQVNNLEIQLQTYTR
jgi:hypothetical protein